MDLEHFKEYVGKLVIKDTDTLCSFAQLYLEDLQKKTGTDEEEDAFQRYAMIMAKWGPVFIAGLEQRQEVF
jgi:hypothetical protein